MPLGKEPDMRQVITTLVDDIDGKGKHVQTVRFGIDGRQLEIDLSAKHEAQLRKTLAPYLAVARKANAPEAPVRKARHDMSQVRAWAAANGLAVSAKGRIPAKIMDQYHAAR